MNVPTILLLAGGSVLIYSAVKNISPLDFVKSILQGKGSIVPAPKLGDSPRYNRDAAQLIDVRARNQGGGSRPI